MKQVAILFTLLFGGLLFSSQGNQDPSELDKMWKQVEQYQDKQRPQSALKVVDEILEAAIEHGYQDHWVKALEYKSRYIAQTEEDGWYEASRLLETHIDRIAQPGRSILYSLTAEFYKQYMQRTGWQRRELTRQADPGDDPRNWVAADFAARSGSYFMKSLEADELLQQTPLGPYARLIDTAKTAVELRPTLYDLLAHDAIAFYSSSFQPYRGGGNTLVLTGAQYFIPADEYTELVLQEDGTEEQILKIYRDLLAFRLDRGSVAPLVDADLRRLEFVYAHSIHPKKDSLYLNALERMSDKYEDHPAWAEVIYNTAAYYAGLDEGENRWSLRKALELARSAVERYPDSYGAKLNKQLIAQIMQKHYQLHVEEVYVPGQAVKYMVEYKNVDILSFNLYELSVEQYLQFNRLNSRERKKFITRLKVAQNKEETLPDPGDHRMHRTEYWFEDVERGFYLLTASTETGSPENDEMVAAAPFQINCIAASFVNQNDGANRLFVFDRVTGKPMPNAEVRLYDNRNEREQGQNAEHLLRTDNQGKVTLPAGRRPTSWRVEVKWKDDYYIMSNGIFSGETTSTGRQSAWTLFFSDRAIYRPGQTVHFKAVLLEHDKDRIPAIAPGQKVTIELYDANRQKLDELELVSNDFGSVSGSFTTPAGKLGGQMYLKSDFGGEYYFRVEEYKRPRFEVNFEPYKGTAALGDTITLSGNVMSYAGTPVDGAKVRYRVVREARFPYWYGWYRGPIPSSPSLEIGSGELQVNERGGFSVDFEAIPDRGIDPKYRPVFTYRLEVDAIDPSGEVQQGGTSVSLSYQKVQVVSPIAAKIRLDSLKAIPVQTVNASGQPVSASVTVSLTRLEMPEPFKMERYWQVPDTQQAGLKEFSKLFPHEFYLKEATYASWEEGETVFSTTKSIEGEGEIAIGPDLLTGVYKLTLKAGGEEVEEVRYVQLWSPDAKNNPSQELLSATTDQKSYQPGETAVVYFHSPLDELYLFYSLEKRGEKLREEWVEVKNVYSIEVPIDESDRGGLNISLFGAALNRSFQKDVHISVPWTNKELEVSFETFRDELKPGEEEEWTVKISGEQKDAVLAEVLASMYDASLDAIYQHHWQKTNFPNFYSRSWTRIYGFGQQYAQRWGGYGGYEGIEFRKYPSFFFNKGNLYPNYYRGGERDGMMTFRESLQGMAPGVLVQGGSGTPGKMEADDMQEESLNNQDNAIGTVEEKIGGVRENLNETVFFYPQLMTDSAGNVRIQFTMNEAITAWNFRLFAHTKELKQALESRKVVTRKKLMVFPNVPRFVRTGDEWYLQARVQNLTGEAMEATAYIELIDPVTENSIRPKYLMDEASKTIKIADSASTVVSWKLNVKDYDHPAWKIRVSARAGEHTDGEQHVIPVLPDEVMVTETMPMWVSANSSKEYEFERFMQSEGADHYRYTLEVTENPVWYAIQALPWLAEEEMKNSDRIFYRYYAHALGVAIVRQNPQIQRVFERWKGTDALESPLLKNQELKNALLEETPWVLEGLDETEQRKRIALLFDMNNMQYELNALIAELRERQMSSGGFAWFPGGRESWYISQRIAEGFGHLRALGIYENETDFPSQLVEQSVRFIDQQLLEHYKDQLEYSKELHLSSTVIHWMYTRMLLDDYEMSQEVQEAHDAYLELAREKWTDHGLYLQALIAMVMKHEGIEAVASDMLISFTERARQSEELGMYWDLDYGYHWYRLPVETQTVMIEAYSKLGAEQSLIDRQKLYLLKLKQTNRWPTAASTARAIYVLLQGKGQWVDVPEAVEVRIAGEVVEVPQADKEAGTGYYKMSWEGEEITEQLGDISLNNPNDHVAWGAAYWQYFQPISEVESSGDNPLRIEKELYVLVNTPEGPVLKKPEEAGGLEVGDRIRFRLTIQTDRPMDYVHLKDLRAAGLEPDLGVSGYRWQGGLGYYESNTDLAKHFFFSHLPEGRYMLEYDLKVINPGTFSQGFATLQCMYAPEFASHTGGSTIEINKQ